MKRLTEKQCVNCGVMLSRHGANRHWPYKCGSCGWKVYTPPELKKTKLKKTVTKTRGNRYPKCNHCGSLCMDLVTRDIHERFCREEKVMNNG